MLVGYGGRLRWESNRRNSSAYWVMLGAVNTDEYFALWIIPHRWKVVAFLRMLSPADSFRTLGYHLSYPTRSGPNVVPHMAFRTTPADITSIADFAVCTGKNEIPRRTHVLGILRYVDIKAQTTVRTINPHKPGPCTRFSFALLSSLHWHLYVVPILRGNALG